MMRRDCPTVQPASGPAPSRQGRAGNGEARRSVTVWDLPLRLFHWLVATMVLLGYLTWRLRWMDWHAWTGEALLALLLWRFAWGFVGSDTARFSHFLRAPGAVLHHLGRLRRREPDDEAGHNPAGGWMVLLLLALLLGQSLTGIYVNNDVADVGPLTALTPAPVANLITLLHALVWDALMVAIALHLIAVLAYRLLKGQNLVLPLITGRKRLPERIAPPHMARLRRAFLVLGCAAAAAAALAAFS